MNDEWNQNNLDTFMCLLRFLELSQCHKKHVSMSSTSHTLNSISI